MGRTGLCLGHQQNSFWSTLKSEYDDQRPCPTHAEAISGLSPALAQVFASVVELDRPLTARDRTGAGNARTSDSDQSPAQGSDPR